MTPYATYIYIEPVGVLSRPPSEYKQLAYPEIGEPAPFAQQFVRSLGFSGPLTDGGGAVVWKMITHLFPKGASYSTTPRMNDIWNHLLRWSAPRIDGIKSVGANRIDSARFDHRYHYGIKNIRWIIILPAGTLNAEELKSSVNPELRDSVFLVDHSRGNKHELLWTAAAIYSTLGYDVGPESALATIFQENY